MKPKNRFVAINASLNLLFSLYLVPLTLINPFNTSWVFAKNSAFRDLSGHAIGSMFYSVDQFRNPIGIIGNYGKELGSTTLFWNSNPLFSLIQKILYHLNLIPAEFQFIGIEIFLGIFISGLSMYFLVRKLGGSALSAIFASNVIVLSTSVLTHYFNDSLTWQFLVICSMLLYLSDQKLYKNQIYWSFVLFMTITSQAYFFLVVLTFYFFAVLKNFILSRKVLQPLTTATWNLVLISFAYYQMGAFTLDPAQRMTSLISAQELSCTVECLLDSRNFGLISLGAPNNSTGESWRYLGISVIVLTLISLIMFIKSIVKQRQIPRLKNIDVLVIVSISAIFFVLSLGPVWRFHGLEFNLPGSAVTEFFFMNFRATGRFSIPLFLIIVALASLSLDLVKNIEWRKFLLIALLTVQFLEMTRMYEAIAFYSNKGANSSFTYKPLLDETFSQVERFEVIEANSGDIENIPWQEFSYYALKYEIPINSWHFLARYDSGVAAKQQSDSFENATNCRFESNSLYVINEQVFNAIPLECRVKLERVGSQDKWSYFKVN